MAACGIGRMDVASRGEEASSSVWGGAKGRHLSEVKRSVGQFSDAVRHQTIVNHLSDIVAVFYL